MRASRRLSSSSFLSNITSISDGLSTEPVGDGDRREKCLLSSGKIYYRSLLVILIKRLLCVFCFENKIKLATVLKVPHSILDATQYMHAYILIVK